MKRLVPVFLSITALALFIGTQGPTPQSPEDIQKNLVLVDESQAAPDSMKAGLETMNARDSIAMLSFLASDLLKGSIRLDLRAGDLQEVKINKDFYPGGEGAGWRIPGAIGQVWEECRASGEGLRQTWPG